MDSSSKNKMDSSSKNKMDSSSRRMDSSSKYQNKRGIFLGGKFKMSIRNLVGSSNGNKSSNHHRNNSVDVAAAEAQSSSNNNSNDDTVPTTAAGAGAGAGADAPSSVQSKRKLRILRTSSKKNVGGVGMDLDDIMEPSAQAQDRQLHKQLSFKNISATKTAAPKQPLSPSLVTSTSEMRQRLQAIEEMIAQGRAEMETLKTVESIKLQRVARGFLQRIRTKQLRLEKAAKGSTTNTNRPPLPNKKASNGTTASTKKKRKRLKQSTSKSESKDAKSLSTKYKDSADKNTSTSTHSGKEKSTSSHNSSCNKKEAAAMTIQTLWRGYLLRLKTTTTAPTAASKKKGPSKKSSREKDHNSHNSNTNHVDRGRDHYTWDNSGDGSGKDHYAWEEQQHPHHSSAKRRHSNKLSSSTNNNSNKKSPKKGNSSKAAPSSKSKAKRGNSLKNNSSGKEGSTDRTRKDTNDSSMVDKSMVDQSLAIQDLEQTAANKKSSSSGSMSLNPSSLEHSKPIHPDSSDNVALTNVMSTSSGGLAVSHEHPDEIQLDGSNDNVFEDNPSDDEGETVTSLSHQSFRSVRSFQSHQSYRSNRGSVASSFMSKLTDDDDDEYVLREADELESLSSKEEAHLLDNDFGESESHEASEDWLALSIMATAPKNKHRGGELGHDSGTRHQKKKDKKMKDTNSKQRHKHRSKHHQDEDELSVSVMATAPRRNRGDSDDNDNLSDDSRSSYNYAPRYDKRKKKSTRTGRKQTDDGGDNDDLSGSVMAVAAEVSDWEGNESEFELASEDDNEEISDYYDDDDDYVGDDDSDDYLSDSVMAVAAGDDTDFEDDGEDEDDADHNPREDDMSITSCETDLPKETYRRDRERNTRRRRQHRRSRDAYEGDSDVIDAEDVSVLSTASNKRHKKSHQKSQHKSKRKAHKAAKQNDDGALNLLPQYPDASSESGEEDLFKGRKRRSRRKSRESPIILNDDEALQARLAEVNKLIAESQQEIEGLKELEAIKIQAFVRMYQSRVAIDVSGSSVTHMRTALSRTGTKPMNMAAVKMQALVRGIQIRAKPEDAQPTVKKRTRRVRKKRIQQEEVGNEADDEGEDEDEDEDDKAMLQERLEEVDREMKRCQEAVEAQNATKIQSLARGVVQRSKDILNPKNIGVVKIQRFVRAALRIVQLRKKLVTIAESKANEIQSLAESSKAEIAEYSPEKFDNMDTRVKMVNFLKKQIEKENEATEKLVMKIKALKEDNISLRTANNTDVCTVSRLQIENETLDDKRKALGKINQNWVDAIEDHKGRIERVIASTKLYKYQTRVTEKYIFEVVRLAEEKCTNKKLLREITFLANHTEVMGGSGRANEAIELPM